MCTEKFWQICNIVITIAVAFLHLPCATIWQNFWGEGMAEVILDTRPYDPLHSLQLTKRGEKGGLKTNDRK